MGYRGIPSRGCLPCRQRRVKCDETRPVCQKCSRGRRSCGGWRERWDLIFRDEGLKISRKADTEKEKSEISTSSESASDTTEKQLTPPVHHQLILRDAAFSMTLQPPPQIPLETKALSFFSWAYSAIPTINQTSNIPGYLACFEILFPGAATGSLLQVTGNAVSLAALGEHIKDNGIIRKSQEQYIRALRIAREEFASRQLPTNDTILAVLMMGLYEQISCPSSTLLGWSSHIKGALHLAKLQKLDGSEDHVTWQLHRAVQNQNLIGLVQSQRLHKTPPFSGPLESMQRDLRVRPLITYFTRILDFREKLTPLLQSGCASVTITDWELLMQELIVLSIDVQEWPKKTGRNIGCQSFQVMFPPSIETSLPLIPEVGIWSVYPAVWASLVWNAYRIARCLISLTCIQLGCLAEVWFPETNCINQETEINTIHCMSQDILSSAPPILFPELLKQLPQPDRDNVVRFTDLPDMGREDNPRPKAGNALALLWPLHFVATDPYILEEDSQMAKETLDYIGSNVGLKIANALGTAHLDDQCIPMLSYPIQ